MDGPEWMLAIGRGFAVIGRWHLTWCGRQPAGAPLVDEAFSVSSAQAESRGKMIRMPFSRRGLYLGRTQ